MAIAQYQQQACKTAHVDEQFVIESDLWYVAMHLAAPRGESGPWTRPNEDIRSVLETVVAF